MKALHVLPAPDEFENLKDYDLNGKVCVVFDVLRATISISTGLGNGVLEFLPARVLLNG